MAPSPDATGWCLFWRPLDKVRFLVPRKTSFRSLATVRRDLYANYQEFITNHFTTNSQPFESFYRVLPLDLNEHDINELGVGNSQKYVLRLQWTRYSSERRAKEPRYVCNASLRALFRRCRRANQTGIIYQNSFILLVYYRSRGARW